MTLHIPDPSPSKRSSRPKAQDDVFSRHLADYDEALAFSRAPSPDMSRAATLLDAALAQFRALGMATWEVRAVALQDQFSATAPMSQPQAVPVLPDSLTAREAEVLRLVAGGRTNREIAAELFLSLPTVQRHIANIYTKIGARKGDNPERVKTIAASPRIQGIWRLHKSAVNPEIDGDPQMIANLESAAGTDKAPARQVDFGGEGIGAAEAGHAVDPGRAICS